MAEAPFLLIGNPDNRRVALFKEALPQGAPLFVVAHATLAAELLAEPEAIPASLRALPATPTLVRIDSPGEDLRVSSALLALGYDAARDAGASTVDADALASRPLARGEVRAPTQEHLGFVRVLQTLQRALVERPAWRATQSPDEIAAAFDKRETHRRLSAAGVPVPRALDGGASHEALVDSMRAHEVERVFVKHRYGSSASCLLAYSNRRDSAGEYLLTSLKREGARRFNSLKLQRYDDDDAREALTFVLREGAHVEEHVPKARLEDAYFDLRVLVIDGEACFTVVRKSRHPITNLHLGGERGTLEALTDAFGASLLQRAHEVAERAAACFSLLAVGVDVLVEPDGATCRVLECNAFGDLLPGLLRDGLDPYATQIAAARRRQA